MKWQTVARRIRVPMGFLFAAMFLVLARPDTRSMLLSLLLVIPGLLLRAYASGYVKKNAELTMTGPYAYTRNPLYLGSSLIAFGFAVAARNLWIAIALALLFSVIYIPVIRAEEEFLRTTFAEFERYSALVPRFFPRPAPANVEQPSGSFSMALYKRHREYNAFIGASSIYLALIALRFLRP